MHLRHAGHAIAGLLTVTSPDYFAAVHTGPLKNRITTMTSIDTAAAPRRPALATGARVSRAFARISAAWADYAMRRRTFRALDRLSPHELDDIGLTRADVDAMR